MVVQFSPFDVILGIISTDIDLILHPSIVDCFSYSKLIGPDYDKDSSKFYSYEIYVKLIEIRLK